MMKAVEITAPGGPDVLKLTDRPRPAPQPSEVLIEVAAAGVNRPDVLQRKGLYPPPPGASDLPGLEVAGRIAAIGAEVTAFKKGDQVCALIPGGGYAEFALADAGSCLPIPAELSLVEAATLPETVFTVWANVFDDAALQPGEALLVHGGTSGVGATAIQMAKARGARVFASAGSEEKVAACNKLGADFAFNYKSENWEKAVQDQGGADVVLDMAGGDFVQRNLNCLNFKGRHVSIAMLCGNAAEIRIFEIMRKQLRLTGSTMKARSLSEKARLARDIRSEVWPLLESGKMKPTIDRTFPLADAASAHERMEAGQHIGKMALVVKG